MTNNRTVEYKISIIFLLLLFDQFLMFLKEWEFFGTNNCSVK